MNRSVLSLDLAAVAVLLTIFLISCGGGGAPFTRLDEVVVRPADFSISFPSEVRALQAMSVTLPVTINALNGFTGTVRVTLEGAPTGLSAPQVDVASGQGSTLTLSVASAIASGKYTVQLQGASGTLVHKYDLVITVPMTLIFGEGSSPGAKISEFLMDPDTGTVTTLLDPIIWVGMSRAMWPSADPLGQMLFVTECSSPSTDRGGGFGVDRLDIYSISPGDYVTSAEVINYPLGECPLLAAIRPDGTAVYVLTIPTDTSLPAVSKIHSYQIDRSTLKVTEMVGSPLITKERIGTLVLHPAGHAAYALAPGVGDKTNLQVFTIDASGQISESTTLLNVASSSMFALPLLISPTGNFLNVLCGDYSSSNSYAITSIPLDPYGQPGPPVLVNLSFDPYAPVMDAQGRFIFAADRNSGHSIQSSVPIYSVTLDSITGKAGSVVSSAVDVTEYLLAYTTEKSGRYLLVNGSGNVFTTYAIDAKTGALSKQPGSPSLQTPPDFGVALPLYAISQE